MFFPVISFIFDISSIISSTWSFLETPSENPSYVHNNSSGNSPSNDFLSKNFSIP